MSIPALSNSLGVTNESQLVEEPDSKRIKVGSIAQRVLGEAKELPSSSSRESSSAEAVVDKVAAGVVSIRELLSGCPYVFVQGVLSEDPNKGGFNQQYTPEGCPLQLSGNSILNTLAQAEYYSDNGVISVNPSRLSFSMKKDILEMDAMQKNMWTLVNTNRASTFSDSSNLYDGMYTAFSSNMHLFRYLSTTFVSQKEQHEASLQEELSSKSPKEFIREQLGKIQGSMSSGLIFSDVTKFLETFSRM